MAEISGQKVMSELMGSPGMNCTSVTAPINQSGAERAKTNTTNQRDDPRPVPMGPADTALTDAGGVIIVIAIQRASATCPLRSKPRRRTTAEPMCPVLSG